MKWGFLVKTNRKARRTKSHNNKLKISGSTQFEVSYKRPMLSHTLFLVLTVFLSIESKEKIMPFADVIDDHRLSSYRACVRQNILILSAASWWCKLYQFNWVIKWALSLYWMQFYYVMSNVIWPRKGYILFHCLSLVIAGLNRKNVVDWLVQYFEGILTVGSHEFLVSLKSWSNRFWYFHNVKTKPC